MCDDMGFVKRVLAVEQKEEHIMDEYQELFKGLGCVPGEISIQLRPDAEPVIEPCRKSAIWKMQRIGRRIEENGRKRCNHKDYRTD